MSTILDSLLDQDVRGKQIEVLPKSERRIKTHEPACLDICHTDLHSLSKCDQSHFIFSHLAFDQPQTFTQYFACILVAPSGYHIFNKSSLMVRKDNVSCGHKYLSLKKETLADHANFQDYSLQRALILIE
jgi:hypothetical protein